MPPVDRTNPVRAKSSDSRYSVMEFMREFPDDEACLQWLWRTRCAVDAEGKKVFCPKCELDRPFHRVSGRPAWDCDYCGYHMHPTADTIFHKSSTSLHLWFYAMFLVSQTRCGISGKQLERELGVTYKTAWRMLNKIRNQLMDEADGPQLSGEVEVDETAMGGKPRASDGKMTRQEAVKWAKRKKTTVVGMVERGGRIHATLAENREQLPVRSIVEQFVLPSSMVFTDDWAGYRKLDQHFASHRRIRHAEKIYVEGDVHTNTIEGFFGNLKRGIAGTYHAVSRKWLQGYLNESPGATTAAKTTGRCSCSLPSGRPCERDRSGDLSLGFPVRVLAPQRAGDFLEVAQDSITQATGHLKALVGRVRAAGMRLRNLGQG